jgi:BirA family transcriptional regulator, biotin operon repressor / biotin---[acetyl-CoA-carboxylase] ligase
MAALAAGGVEEGVWLRAERQTGGRGRSGRSWSSAGGNLHISTLVRLRPGDPAPHTLALVAAVAAHAAVEALVPGRGVTIKWPNDLMAGPAKLCGMLLERVGDAVVVGFGLNVTHAPEIEGRMTIDLASLGAATDSNAAHVAEALAEKFGYWLGRWRQEGLTPVRQAWQAAAHPVGTALRAILPDGTETVGSFAGLAEDGALVIRREDGGLAMIHAGDVFAIQRGR